MNEDRRLHQQSNHDVTEGKKNWVEFGRRGHSIANVGGFTERISILGNGDRELNRQFDIGCSQNIAFIRTEAC